MRTVDKKWSSRLRVERGAVKSGQRTHSFEVRSGVLTKTTSLVMKNGIGFVDSTNSRNYFKMIYKLLLDIYVDTKVIAFIRLTNRSIPFKW